jgi:hypothetical protein
MYNFKPREKRELISTEKKEVDGKVCVVETFQIEKCTPLEVYEARLARIEERKQELQDKIATK